MFDRKNFDIPKPPKNATKEQILHYKKLKREFAIELRGKKFKARAMEQEKDPYIKAIYLKLSPEDLAVYISKERAKTKKENYAKLGDSYMQSFQNRAYKNILTTSDRKKFVFKLLMESKIMLYFYGVEKERRRIRWLTHKELFRDSYQSLFFVICISVILASLDFFLSVLRYLNVL